MLIATGRRELDRDAEVLRDTRLIEVVSNRAGLPSAGTASSSSHRLPMNDVWSASRLGMAL